MTSYTTSQNIDTNINNYTIGQMMTILNLQDLNEEEIKLKTNYYINRYNNSARLNPENAQLATFFYNMQIALLSSISHNNNDDDDDENDYEKDDGDDIYLQEDEENDYNPTKKFGLSIPQPNHIQEGFTTLESQDRQTNTLWRNEYTSQKDINQNDKITDRKHKIEIYNNEQMPMNKQQLGINNSYVVPVQQDSLNPNLKNIIYKTLIIDSFYRQNGSITDFTLELSEPITNTLSMRLFSFAIPFSWDNISNELNNTCMWIVSPSNNLLTISLQNGNYTSQNIVEYLNLAFINAGITGAYCYLSDLNGLLKINFYGATYIDKNGIINTIDKTYSIVFFEYTANLECIGECNQNIYIDQTLGWLLGYREIFITINENGNIADTLPNFTYSKYFTLCIDDFNKNHINNNLVCISNINQKSKLPSYFNYSLPTQCVSANTNDYGVDKNNRLNLNGLNLLQKYSDSSVNTFKVLDTFPKVLTQSQLYTINSILSTNAKLSTDFTSKSPSLNNVIGIIPIKLGNIIYGSLYTDQPGNLGDANRREYFGPSTISKLKVQLFDDKGNIVKLKMDWSFTIIVNVLYQY